LKIPIAISSHGTPLCGMVYRFFLPRWYFLRQAGDPNLIFLPVAPLRFLEPLLDAFARLRRELARRSPPIAVDFTPRRIVLMAAAVIWFMPC
jgi:hypothetical protein